MVKSDIEIARSAKMKPIREVLDKVNVPDNPEAFSPMGRHIAKLNLEYIEKLSEKKSNLILFNHPKPQFDIVSATADLIVIDRWTKH